MKLISNGFKQRYDNFRETEYEKMLSLRGLMLVLTHYKSADSWKGMIMKLVNPKSDRPLFVETYQCKDQSLTKVYGSVLNRLNHSETA